MDAGWSPEAFKNLSVCGMTKPLARLDAKRELPVNSKEIMSIFRAA